MFSLLIAILIALLFIFLSYKFVVTFNNNLSQKDIDREKYETIVTRLRMGKMLQALNIHLATYLHQMPLIKVHESMSKCASCHEANLCDQELSQGHIDVESIVYCPNQDCLKKYKQQEIKAVSY